MEKLKEINKKFAEIAELKSYLTSTDHNVLKWKEGCEIDAEILSNRATARDAINALEDEISVLQNEIEESLETEEL